MGKKLEGNGALGSEWEIIGTIEKVDRQLRQLKVVTGDDEYEWVKFEDIVSVK
ncbi:YolD-like family protein [Paenibacillus validus]|uniref:YolD-like family protein n=1 Tax=Paenibacillus validus TaxID=44253 RepID=UPI0013DF2EF8|nr:YolD-like family protein [Paenibacillus validus]MED4599852.1 YolD-like family protein [Paenibacillus validus]MED4606115.1 YolD-like family protein [Paenibacillus validus]